MSGTTLALIGWIVWAVPDFAGQSVHQRLSIGTVFRTPGIRPILATIFAWMTAHNILYTYVAPFAVLSGLQGRVGLLLLGFGIAALAGIWVTGLLVDRMLRRLVLVSLLAFAGVALALGTFGAIPAVVIAGIAVWGLSFGGAATQLQTASADAAGNGVDLANAMITTVWNSAIAAGGILAVLQVEQMLTTGGGWQDQAGGILGGILLDHFGAAVFPRAVLALALIALAIVFGARRHGFVPGPRAHT